VKKVNLLWHFLITYKFLILLIALLLQLVLPVFFTQPEEKRIVSYFCITFTILSSILIFNNSKRPRLLMAISILVVLALLFNWIDYFDSLFFSVKLPRLILALLIYFTIFTNIFKEFNRRDEVTLDFIFGAISGYLILGFIGAVVSAIIEHFYPGSFTVGRHAFAGFQEYIYFNFVTLTTLGYGDIIPHTEQGQIHAVVMAIAGQLYLTITIAMIIGQYLIHSKKNVKSITKKHSDE